MTFEANARMTLNMLVLQASDSITLPGGVHIRQMTHHITQMFMALLPRVDINGSSKVVVVLGPRGEQDLFDNVLGVTSIFIEDFDFDGFLSLDLASQDVKLLDALRGALIAVATRRGENENAVEAINSTADAVVQSDFQLVTLIKKLSKVDKNKKQKINAFRELNSRVGERWYCEVISQQNNERREADMNDVPGFIDRSELFKSAEVDGSAYRVKNRMGKVVFDIQL